jgi:hypothetical protein
MSDLFDSELLVYSAVFLIISSDGIPEYAAMKSIARSYFGLFSERVKYVFVESCAGVSCPQERGDTLMIPPEVRGSHARVISDDIHFKTMRALEYMCSNYRFEYAIRTNLSTLWHLPNLLLFLDDAPRQRFAGGFVTDNFISGTGIMVSRDVAESLPEVRVHDTHLLNDDIIISRTISSLGIVLSPPLGFKCGRCPDDVGWRHVANQRMVLAEETIMPDILNFRIKHPGNRALDLEFMRAYASQIYTVGGNTENLRFSETFPFCATIIPELKDGVRGETLVSPDVR